MKYWSSEHTYDRPWETVAQAAWRKYPNPMNPAVTGIDVIDREVVDGVLHTHRLVASKWGFPRWAQVLIGRANICYASERSEVDPDNRKMILKTRNLTLCNYIAFDEIVRYSPHPQDADKTLQTQEATVTVQGVPLPHSIEDLLASKISFNADKGRQAMQWIMDNYDDFKSITKRSMDDLQSAAKKSFDGIHNLTTPPSPQSIPKL